MSHNNINTNPMEKLVLAGAAGYTAFQAVTSLKLSLAGSDSLYDRVNHWNDAQELKNPVAALGKRTQVLIGSDSLSTRASNFSKAVAYTVCAVLFVDIFNHLGKCTSKQSETATLLNDLSTVKVEAHTCSQNLASASELLASLQGNYTQLQNDMQGCTSAKEGFKNFSDACHLKMREVNDNLGALEVKAKDKQALQTQLGTCNQEKTTCRSEGEQKNAEISGLNARIETAEKDRKEAQTKATDTLAQLGSCNQQKTAIHSEGEQKNAEISGLNSRIQTTEKDREEAQTKASDTQKQLSDCQATQAKAANAASPKHIPMNAPKSK